ncbi:MAG: amidohydrolase family protein [Gracilimonas sp.]|uniref:N-acyl-D-amino-acid deacylase family protein n=1 Tax=Gracilimonas sp. TaxID=1974203 RepID=UPI0019C2D6DC|nr:amidohydrolase family protein [Gracilimonas sp.]MBD3617222.1 amidohydrolase family protein [Gracilimonas sp.]
MPNYFKEKVLKILFIFFIVFLASWQGLKAQNDSFDVLLKNGYIYDGSGNPWFKADIGIKGERIQRIGDLEKASALEVIDLSGLYVSPGFIDIHSHAYGPIAMKGGIASDDVRRRQAPNLISQGITTIVGNHDGRSVDEPFDQQLAELKEKGIGVNTALMVGHNTIRSKVMGDEYEKPATISQIKEMQGLVRKAMEEGAFGMSAGLEYFPGRWSNTDELIALVEEITPFGGVYISHQRSEAKTPMLWLPSDNTPTPPTLLDAVEETIEIGRQTGATVVASHLKARGSNFWGGSIAAVSLIQQARDQGVSVYADQYPYNTSGSDGNTRLLPRWVFDFERFGLEESGSPNYNLPLNKVLEAPELRTALYEDIRHSLAYRGGAERIVVFEHPDSTYIGKSIKELAGLNEIAPEDMVIELQRRGFQDRPGGARLRSFSMHQNDLDAIAKTDWTATTTDGMITLPEDGQDIHARYYGTFPRKIHKYALMDETISVAHAIRSSTSLPAQIMGIENRGLIEEGYYADLVVFDMNTIQDLSTFFEPHQHSAGIEFVFINGKQALANGKLTRNLFGKTITPKNSQNK